MRGCLGKCSAGFFRATNIIELVPPTTNTGTNRKKGSEWSNKIPKLSNEKTSKYQCSTRIKSCDFVLPKNSPSQKKLEARTCQSGEKQDLAGRTQVTPQDCALPGATLPPINTVNANIRTLKLLTTRKDGTYGKPGNSLLHKKESSKISTHEKCVPGDVPQSHFPSGQMERGLQLKDNNDNECEKPLLKLNGGRNMPTAKSFLMENRWLAEIQIPKSKTKKMESYEEFASGLGEAAKKAKGSGNFVNTLTHLYNKKQDRTSSSRNTSIICKLNEVPEDYSQTGEQKDEQLEENTCFRSSTPTENYFDLGSHRLKLDRKFAVDGNNKRLATSTDLKWPKHMYGCRKNDPVKPITTTTCTFKSAISPSKTYFHAQSTKTMKVCVDAEPAIIPICMNGTLKRTSNMLPVKHLESDSVEDSDLSDETEKDTIELDLFFVSISK